MVLSCECISRGMSCPSIYACVQDELPLSVSCGGMAYADTLVEDSQVADTIAKADNDQKADSEADTVLQTDTIETTDPEAKADVCLMYVSCMSYVCLMYVSCMSHVCLMYVLCMSHIYVSFN